MIYNFIAILVLSTITLSSFTTHAIIVEAKTKEIMDKTLTNKKNIILEIYKKDCPTCLIMESRVEEVATRVPDVTIIKVEGSTHSGREMQRKYAVSNYPTFIFLKEGNRVKSVAGKMSADELERHIQDTFKKNKD